MATDRLLPPIWPLSSYLYIIYIYIIYIIYIVNIIYIYRERTFHSTFTLVFRYLVLTSPS